MRVVPNTKWRQQLVCLLTDGFFPNHCSQCQDYCLACYSILAPNPCQEKARFIQAHVKRRESHFLRPTRRIEKDRRLRKEIYMASQRNRNEGFIALLITFRVQFAYGNLAPMLSTQNMYSKLADDTSSKIRYSVIGRSNILWYPSGDIDTWGYLIAIVLSSL